jgi:hypothetical protein
VRQLCLKPDLDLFFTVGLFRFLHSPLRHNGSPL